MGSGHKKCWFVAKGGNDVKYTRYCKKYADMHELAFIQAVKTTGTCSGFQRLDSRPEYTTII